MTAPPPYCSVRRRCRTLCNVEAVSFSPQLFGIGSNCVGECLSFQRWELAFEHDHAAKAREGEPTIVVVLLFLFISVSRPEVIRSGLGGDLDSG